MIFDTMLAMQAMVWWQIWTVECGLAATSFWLEVLDA